MMAHESPYYIAKEGMNSGIIELPVCWELDDAPYYLFAIKPSYRKGLSDPDTVLKVWEKEFDFAYREAGFYLLTLHPQISGRGYRLDVLDRLLGYIGKFPDVWIATHEEIAKAYDESDEEDKKLTIDILPGHYERGQPKSF
jgi:hypothetical protein